MEPFTFSQTLRLTRKLRHYTQEQMSQLLHVCRQAYCNYENGSRMPSLDILIRAAEILEVTADYLLTGDPSRLLTVQEYHAVQNFYQLSESTRKKILSQVVHIEYQEKGY